MLPIGPPPEATAATYGGVENNPLSTKSIIHILAFRGALAGAAAAAANRRKVYNQLPGLPGLCSHHQLTHTYTHTLGNEDASFHILNLYTRGFSLFEQE